jgi:hypothetical protein
VLCPDAEKLIAMVKGLSSNTRHRRSLRLPKYDYSQANAYLGPSAPYRRKFCSETAKMGL